MKKDYIAPALEVVILEMPQILSGSPQMGGEYGGVNEPVLAPDLGAPDFENPEWVLQMN